MKKNRKNNRKFIVFTVILLLLSLITFLYYRLFIEVGYSTDYETIGTITKMEFEEDSLNGDKWNLEIKYKDSEKNEIVDKKQVYEESDEYKKLEIHNVKVGSKIKIRTEEGFAEGFLGKRLLYSTILVILED